MLRIALLIFLVLAVLLVVRILRVFAAAYLSRPGTGKPPGAVEGEMVRDPICGTWIDRRLALAARSSGQWVPVCSEKCRASAESA
jgi:hypothetical protein